MDRVHVWIVIAAYNEGTVIGRVVREARTLGHRVLVVNDGSNDDTGPQAYQAGAIVIAHPINLGQGAALATGIEYAISQRADYIATFDADGQHRIEDLQRMLDTLITEKVDIAVGSRFLKKPKNIGLRRRILLKCAVLLTWLTTGIRMTDAHNGLRVMTAEAAGKLRITQNGMAHASEVIELIKRHSLRFVEVPVTILYTHYSLRKGQPLSNALNILLELVTGRLGK